VLVTAPVILVNGGSGLVKLVLLRGLKRLGFDVRRPEEDDHDGAGPVNGGERHLVVRLLHRVRFPLHDHCRKNLRWSDSQVLVRFVLLQALLTPLLLGVLVKVR
jgi:phospho-N-acetylmuramoyl-pentapeptide-transferase